MKVKIYAGRMHTCGHVLEKRPNSINNEGRKTRMRRETSPPRTPMTMTQFQKTEVELCSCEIPGVIIDLLEIVSGMFFFDCHSTCKTSASGSAAAFHLGHNVTGFGELLQIKCCELISGGVNFWTGTGTHGI